MPTHIPTHSSAAGSHLVADGINHSFADRRVLTDVSFSAASGDRVGLVGENGSGKSTLLTILAGLLVADAGTVTHRASFGLLRQELPYAPETPVARVLDDAQHAAISAQTAIEQAGDRLATHPDDPDAAADYAAALEAADRAGAWEASAHRGAMLTGLGLERIAESTRISDLSGGQQLRLALAALLLEAPFTLLLDEPSNHLDDDAARFLEQTLASWPGIVIVASHDRTLLDAVTTSILDLDPIPIPVAVLADAAAQDDGAPIGADRDAAVGELPGSVASGSGPTTDDPGTGLGVRVWGMGYTPMRAAQRDERRRWANLYSAQQQERSDLVHEIEVGSREVNKKHESKSESRITRKFYADKDARVTARRARNARARLAALERERVRRPPSPLSFTIPAEDDGAGGTSDASTAIAANVDPLLRLVSAAHSERLAPVSLTVETGDRVLIEGPNGAGKSTLLAILAGALAPTSGTRDVAERLRIGYLPQDSVFEQPELSAIDSYVRAIGSELAERRPLADFGLLATRDHHQPVGALSVGQRRRLALAILLADPPSILLLDEPSNHLSLTLVEELDLALRDYPGAVVIASHDRWLRAQWHGRRIEVNPWSK